MADYALFYPASAVNDNSGEVAAIGLGTTFQVTSPGWVTAIRFWKGASDAGPWEVFLFDKTDGSALAYKAVSSATNGWNTIALDDPVELTTAGVYMAAFHTATGNYAFAGGTFASAVTVGPIEAAADGESTTGNGSFAYSDGGSAMAMPDSSFGQTYYYVEPLFTDTDPGGEGSPGSADGATQAATSSGVPGSAAGRGAGAGATKAASGASLPGAAAGRGAAGGATRAASSASVPGSSTGRSAAPGEVQAGQSASVAGSGTGRAVAAGATATASATVLAGEAGGNGAHVSGALGAATAGALPGIATGSRRQTVPGSGSRRHRRTQRLKQEVAAVVDGATGEAQTECVAGVATGSGRVDGALIVLPQASAVAGEARRQHPVEIGGAVAEGPLRYYLASKWTPEHLATLRAADAALIASMQ